MHSPPLLPLICMYTHLSLSVSSRVSQVSTAVRLCDGALLVVDAVEGVCSQVSIITVVITIKAWPL